MLLALFRSVSNHFNFFHTIWHYFIVPSCYFIVFHYFSMFVSTFLHGLDGIQAASAASAAVASAAVAVEDGKVDVSTCRVGAAGRMVGSTYRNDQKSFPSLWGLCLWICAVGRSTWWLEYFMTKIARFRNGTIILSQSYWEGNDKVTCQGCVYLFDHRGWSSTTK